AGVLSWAAGDGAAKTIEIPIKKEAASQPDKSFSVRLRQATGAALGAASAVITIHEDSPGCGSAVAGDPTKLRLVGTTDGPATPCDESKTLTLPNGRLHAA